MVEARDGDEALEHIQSTIYLTKPFSPIQLRTLVEEMLAAA